MNFEPLKLTIRNDNFKGDEKRDYDDRYDKRPYDDMPSYSGPKDQGWAPGRVFAGTGQPGPAFRVPGWVRVENF